MKNPMRMLLSQDRTGIPHPETEDQVRAIRMVSSTFKSIAVFLELKNEESLR